MAIEDALMLDLDNGEWLRRAIDQRKQIGGGNHLPPYLYRYISPDTDTTRDKLEDALLNSRLYLCSRTQFNDPFDSRLTWLQPSDDEVRKYVRTAGLRNGIHLDQANQYADHLIAAPQNWGWLNDTLNGTLDKMGISCFSETPRNMLMWSHYAASHKGVAIEYQAFNQNAGHVMDLYPVVYGDDFPSMLLSADFSDRQLFRSVLYKAQCWGYELEWRAVRPGAAGTHAHLDSACVSSVYLGCNVQKHTLDLIRELLTTRRMRGLPGVDVVRMNMQGDSFALTPLPYALNA